MTRTINHPVLQDTYELVLKLKQRRWRCTNPQCSYTTNSTEPYFMNIPLSERAAVKYLISDMYNPYIQ